MCVDTTSGQKQKQQGEKKKRDLKFTRVCQIWHGLPAPKNKKKKGREKRDLKFTRVCQSWHGLPAPKNQEKVGVQKKKGPYIDMGVPELTDDNAA